MKFKAWVAAVVLAGLSVWLYFNPYDIYPMEVHQPMKVVWSGGDRLAYFECSGSAILRSPPSSDDLQSISSGGSVVVRYRKAGFNKYSPAFKFIVFCASRDGSDVLYVVPVDEELRGRSVIDLDQIEWGDPSLSD